MRFLSATLTLHACRLAGIKHFGNRMMIHPPPFLIDSGLSPSDNLFTFDEVRKNSRDSIGPLLSLSVLFFFCPRIRFKNEAFTRIQQVHRPIRFTTSLFFDPLQIPFFSFVI